MNNIINTENISDQSKTAVVEIEKDIMSKDIMSKDISSKDISSKDIMSLEKEFKARDVKSVLKLAEDSLRMAPEFAIKAFYSIPYRNSDGSEIRVEGLSIKAAMELARCWGNCSNAVRIVSEDDEKIIVEGIFVDHETRSKTLRQVSISKQNYNKRTKMVIPMRDDRLNMAIQAGMSKAVRNAILSSLPAFLVEKYLKLAKELGFKKIKKEDRFKNAVKAFAVIGVTESQLKAYVEKSKYTSEDEIFDSLIGLYNAINDGQIKKEDFFPIEENQQNESAKILDKLESEKKRG